MKIYKYKYSLWGFFSAMTLAILAAINANEIRHWLAVLLFGILAAFALTYKNGIEISKEVKYRRFFSIMGKTFGSWKTIPEIQYLSVVRVKQAKYRITGAFIDQERTNRNIYQVNVIYNNNKLIRLFSADKSNAVKNAVEIARYLNLKVLDFTTPGYKGFIPTETI